MNPPWALDPDTDCMKDFIEVMHEQFSPEAFRKLFLNTTMNNKEKTTDDLAAEYAAAVASTCSENGNPLPEAFVHLLESAFVAGYNHVCENNTIMPKELHEQILSFLRKKSNDPNELCSATGKALYILLASSIAMYGNDPEDVKKCINFLDLIKKQITDEFGDVQ